MASSSACATLHVAQNCLSRPITRSMAQIARTTLRYIFCPLDLTSNGPDGTFFVRSISRPTVQIYRIGFYREQLLLLLFTFSASPSELAQQIYTGFRFSFPIPSFQEKKKATPLPLRLVLDSSSSRASPAVRRRRERPRLPFSSFPIDVPTHRLGPNADASMPRARPALGASTLQGTLGARLCVASSSPAEHRCGGVGAPSPGASAAVQRRGWPQKVCATGCSCIGTAPRFPRAGSARCVIVTPRIPACQLGLRLGGARRHPWAAAQPALCSIRFLPSLR